VADVLPGQSFSRTYVYNCERRLFNPKTYTFSFDCGYVDKSIPNEQKHLEQKHLAASITTVISPNPLVLNFLAVLFAMLGAVLKIALDALPKPGARTAASAATTSDATLRLS